MLMSANSRITERPRQHGGFAAVLLILLFPVAASYASDEVKVQKKSVKGVSFIVKNDSTKTVTIKLKGETKTFAVELKPGEDFLGSNLSKGKRVIQVIFRGKIIEEEETIINRPVAITWTEEGDIEVMFDG